MRVRWTKPALGHLDEIQSYVAQESPAAAYRLVNELFDRAMHSLSMSPQIGRPGRVKGTRELVFADLPYIVSYQITDCVDIIAVVHTAREWPRDFP